MPAYLSGQELKERHPENIGMASDRLERINDCMNEYIQEEELAGIITFIARKGEIAHFETYGYADKDTKKKMSLNTIFRIYSMTKPIVSVGLMMLYEKGTFQLWDPISKYIPELKKIKVLVEDSKPPVLEEQKSEIRIIDLLRHTSGLGYGWGKGDYADSLYKVHNVFDSNDFNEFLEKVIQIPLYFQPGTKWRYGISSDILGILIERISGQPLDEYLKEKIFDPLKMNDTGFSVPESKIDRLATVYYETRNGDLKVIYGPETSNFNQPYKIFLGGSGLLSTTHDYSRFSQMLLNGGELDGARLLSPKTVELMTMDHTEGIPNGGGSVYYPTKASGFGLGFSVVKEPSAYMRLSSKGQYGWAGIAGTFFRIDPKEEMIIILMTQKMYGKFNALRSEINNLAYQAIIK